MKKQIEGQQVLTYGYFMELEGFTNCYDSMPEAPGIYLVEDRSGRRHKAKACISFGRMVWEAPNIQYDITYWKEV